MKLNYKILRWGLLRNLKRGVDLVISPTYNCTLDCSYCDQKDLNGNLQIYRKERPVEDWINYIDKFPYRVRSVTISGGEPTIYPGFIELVNQLLEKGIFVFIFTNLTNNRLLKIRPTYKLKIKATYHDCFSLQVFKKHLDRLKDYNVVLREMRTNYFKDSEKWRFFSDEELKELRALQMSPDMRLYTTCYDKVRDL